ncbi:centrosomal protein of 295 kDa-like [Clavelina lepadiformis]|uniref:centrosomal protein of 295 kDa-like n=1 Tax=Clavelina lepadiformis TaxID=159417 RepID=UPI0040432802
MLTRSRITPSPNETKLLLEEQTKHRRRMRLLQVRQQGQAIAKNIRSNVEEKRSNALQDIASELNKQHELSKEVKYANVKQKYAKGLNEFGTAQKDARENCPDQMLIEAMFQEQKKIAKRRYCDAVNQLQTIRSIEEKKQKDEVNRRKLVSQKEKLRAKHIAMLPNPENSSKDSTGTSHENSGNATSGTYQSGCSFVERATGSERNAFDDARAAALKEEEIILQKKQNQLCTENAQQERAHFRHIAALQQTRMENEYRSLENDLKQLQKKDALKRRGNVTGVCATPALDVSLQNLMA